jgi:hypothetical protein
VSTEPADVAPIIVDFHSGPGLHQVSVSPAELVTRSGKVINDAMGIIRQMSQRVRDTVTDMPNHPSEVEVAFGIKFDSAAGAVIARAGVEAAVLVTLRWQGDRPAVVTPQRDRSDANRLFELGNAGGMP